jgi:hypothetical protein
MQNLKKNNCFLILQYKNKAQNIKQISLFQSYWLQFNKSVAMVQGLEAVPLLPPESSWLKYILLTHSGLLLFPEEFSVHQTPLAIVVGSQEPLTRIPVALPPAYEYRVRLFLKPSVTYQTNCLMNLQ